MSESERRKKRNKALLILILCFLGVIILGISAVIFTGYYYLNLMKSPKDIKLEPNPSIIAEEEPLPDEFRDGDAAIARNIAYDNMLSDPDVFNIALAGCDLGSGNYYPRSDAILVLSLNKRDGKIALVSLSRAVYNSIPGVGNKRLNMAYAYGGGPLLVQTIEQNYKIDIDYYMSVNFDTFSTIVDILGGVDIVLTDAEYNYFANKLADNGISGYGPGTYRLNGAMALQYVRLRAIDSDRDRTGRQRKLLLSIFNEFKNCSVSTYMELLNEILPEIETDMPKRVMISHIVNVPKYVNWPLTQDIIPYTKHPLINIGGTEYLLIDWEDNVFHLQKLLYPHKF